MFLSFTILASVASGAANASQAMEQFEFLSILSVANEKCVGQRYNQASIDGHLYRLGMAEGWEKDKIEAEIVSEKERSVEKYLANKNRYCADVQASRDDQSSVLKNMKIID
ncbi:hypothetical protein ABE527_02500 [Brucella sp. TWI432]